MISEKGTDRMDLHASREKWDLYRKRLLGASYLCLILGSVWLPIPENFQPGWLFQTVWLPVLLLALGMELKETDGLSSALKKSGLLYGIYLVLQTAVCVSLLLIDYTRQGGEHRQILMECVKSALFCLGGSSSQFEGVQSVGAAWILPCLCLAMPLCQGILAVRNRWIRWTAAALAAVGSLLLSKASGPLPLGLHALGLVTALLCAGFLIRKYRILEHRRIRWLLIPGLAAWAVSAIIGPMDMGSVSYPSVVLGSVSSLAGAGTVLLAVWMQKDLGQEEKWLDRALTEMGRCFPVGLCAVYFVSALTNWEAAEETILTAIISCGLMVLLCFGVVFGANRIRISRELLEKWEQPVFLTLFGLRIYEAVLETAMMGLQEPRILRLTVRAGLMLLVCWKVYRKLERGKGRALILPGVISVVLLLSSFQTGYDFILELALLILGAMDVPYRKILKVHFVIAAGVFALSVLAGFTGLATQLAYFRGGQWRYAFGIIYPTDFAAHGVYLILTLWAIQKGTNSIPMTLLMGAFFLFQRKYTETRCSEIIMLLGIVFVLGRGLFSHWEGKSGVRRLEAAGNWLYSLGMVLIASAMIAFTVLYGSDIPEIHKLNGLISNRLALGLSAIQTYGIKLFGSPFEMVGAGGTMEYNVGYNFVDCSYCMIQVQYGIAVLLAVLLIYLLVIRQALRAGNRKLAIAFFLVAVACAIEHHLTEIAYDPFLVLPFACFEGEKRDLPRKPIRETTLRWVIWILLGGVLIALLPRGISLTRTVIYGSGLDRDECREAMVLSLGILITAVVGLLYGTVEMLFMLLSHRRVEKRRLAAWGAALFILLGGAFRGEYLLRSQAPKFENRLQESERVISSLRDRDISCRIVVDDIPELYRRETEGTSLRLLPMFTAMEQNMVVFTDGQTNYGQLLWSGFSCYQITEDCRVYTNSVEASQLLGEMGYLPPTE